MAIGNSLEAPTCFYLTEAFMEIISELFPYIVLAAAGWFAGRVASARDRYRSVARALMWIVVSAERRGVYFSPYDRAIIRAAAEVLKP